jgi:CRP/FNR family transcriptional regulator
VTSLVNAVRGALLSSPEVTRLASLRRSTSLYSQGQTADALYFLEDGLIKLTRTNENTNRVILAILGPGELLGDEALGQSTGVFQCDAEVLTTASLWRIPRDLLTNTIATDADFASAVLDRLLQHKLTLARKVELLCLHDVEYRILYYLTELSSLVKPSELDGGYQLPLTQAELADLIGATRETTSTTLYQLERRGLVKLSRRLLTIPSVPGLRDTIGHKNSTFRVDMPVPDSSMTFTANRGM